METNEEKQSGLRVKCLITGKPGYFSATLLQEKLKSYNTLEEVGKDFGVTRERVRQIEVKALRKLRHPSRSKSLQTFFDKEYEFTAEEALEEDGDEE